MQDDVSRLVGIEGLVVTRVVELREQLELEVELVLGAGCCRWCGRGSLKVKDRPVVRVRDLPIAGRVTWLLWRKRRFCCEAYGQTFTETHSALPSRQRVSARLRRHLFERFRGGAAHLDIARDERTSCYEVNGAFAGGGDELLARCESTPARRLSLDEAHHRCSHELATVVSDLDRRRVIDVLDGRSRMVVERYLRSQSEPEWRAIQVVSKEDPYEAALDGVSTANANGRPADRRESANKPIAIGGSQSSTGPAV